jgi:predicted metal-dependent hydrolase
MTNSLLIDGVDIPVRLKRSAVAARMSLRVDPQDGAVVLVLPPQASPAQGMAFVRSKADWIRQHRIALPQHIPFAEGARVPLLGVEHDLRAAPLARRGVWVENGAILVSGRAEHFARRVGDWLKDQARAEITGRALPMAEGIGRSVPRITIRDTHSRWGSCSSRGDLAFSWRLVLAPADVLHYVVAHEVAHLVEMNHSPAFWRVVETLAPQVKPARAWLKRHGGQLHRYG